MVFNTDLTANIQAVVPESLMVFIGLILVGIGMN
jgi:hypothetical protein